MNDDRGPWYLLTGLVIGLAFGLVYTWMFQPVEYVDTTPASLREDYKDRYRALIAVVYLTNGDLVRAKARLELLEDDDVFSALAEQAQRTLAEGNSPDEARALGLLAIQLGQDAPEPPLAITAAPENQSTSPALDADEAPELDSSAPVSTSLSPDINTPATPDE